METVWSSKDSAEKEEEKANAKTYETMKAGLTIILNRPNVGTDPYIIDNIKDVLTSAEKCLDPYFMMKLVEYISTAIKSKSFSNAAISRIDSILSYYVVTVSKLIVKHTEQRKLQRAIPVAPAFAPSIPSLGADSLPLPSIGNIIDAKPPKYDEHA